MSTNNYSNTSAVDESSSTPSQKQGRRLSYEKSDDSPKKMQSTLSKPNPVTPTKAIHIEAGLASSSKTSLDEKLPLWVAGASPAKFITLEDVIKISNSLEKMAIVHEIAIDPKFNVEDLHKKDDVYDAVKSSMHKAYWDVLKTELSKDQPSYSHAFTLLKDLKELITEQLVTGNLNNALLAVEEILDFEQLKSLLDRKMLDFKEVLKLVLQVLQRLCAPIRDEFVQKLKAEEDLVNLFKGIFDLLELMKIDMANFALSQNRGTIESYSAEIEREEFMKALQYDPNGAQYTKYWLKKILDEFRLNQLLSETNNTSASEPIVSKNLSQVQITDLIINFYLTLLETNPNELQFFPETLKLDQSRFLALGEKLLQLILTAAAIFVTSNLAGKDACENPIFKSTLKNELIIVLNDISWSNYVEKLENVHLQCEKNVKLYVSSWTEKRSTMLRDQIQDLQAPQNSIRMIAKTRIRAFFQLVLRRAGDQLKLPPGLSVFQSELAAFTSKFYAIVLHNWNTFGTFYAEILRQVE